ncbi:MULTISPECIES: tetratricopeptide repeat protein [Cyanophyceae]|uniref:tetratricopeptide repeat protein n=1 Tax=Cyanophyceae TaxID=3028117 RepID=UPI00074D347A|nr:MULTISPECIES: tetratricopeptide repeat protein [Cyanophyceae]MBF2086613.1 tetratricopeptide repeat protein [Thermoleptolyngbya sp. C42_A2020_037]BAU40244.1 lipoprotein NlpI [Leptolyngbya sp. O-77]
MDDSLLPVVYLSVLVALLAIAGIFLFRQVLRTRKVETALTRLQNKLTKGPGTAQEYYELGSIYLDKKLYSQAIAQFQKALKSKDLTEPENAALVYNALGYAYAAQEQYDLAIRQYKEALEKQPKYVTALNNLGFAYEKKQLVTQAIEAYEQALAIDPKNGTAKRRTESLKRRVATPA